MIYRTVPVVHNFIMKRSCYRHKQDFVMSDFFRNIGLCLAMCLSCFTIAGCGGSETDPVVAGPDAVPTDSPSDDLKKQQAVPTN
jgi:hypothetical protein